MRRFFDRLKPEEKRLLAAGTALLGAGLLFLFFFALPRHEKLNRARDTLSGLERRYRMAERKGEEQKETWRLWENTEQVMKKLKAERMYSAGGDLERFRLDLQRLFNEAKIHIPGMMQYDYAHYEEEKIRKVIISFSLRGTYDILKKFLFSVETFPKFVHVERIDFLDINPANGVLLLKISVSGYYAY